MIPYDWPWPNAAAHRARQSSGTPHPLFSRDFEFVAHRHNWGEDRVHLHDENGALFSLPIPLYLESAAPHSQPHADPPVLCVSVAGARRGMSGLPFAGAGI
jgi:hypothetical protein